MYGISPGCKVDVFVWVFEQVNDYLVKQNNTGQICFAKLAIHWRVLICFMWFEALCLEGSVIHEICSVWFNRLVHKYSLILVFFPWGSFIIFLWSEITKIIIHQYYYHAWDKAFSTNCWNPPFTLHFFHQSKLWINIPELILWFIVDPLCKAEPPLLCHGLVTSELNLLKLLI